ncbi:2-amino-4-hydroxy-6-hydroxymethyldihydropteridine diphosphokinase [Alicyclobacillus cellulosilyticus]|uniref:2-amino-4-hydroxy-6- hydroxymethyldihydropteridine diphosphokinase n=1 Tax=Alicyclobacillus cellulosilyticus TaxID=1003997 RepID=UPI001E45AE63|nr:2-amino-4-hydroxy-6-hydroxymethyldihydropteridine diphosphokinase [Alicyclobacillus cellulosilyticus]
MTAYIGLGSNLGDRLHHLAFAVRSLRALAAGDLVCSAVYETKPVGWIDQPDFLNMVVRLETDRSPRSLLSALMAIEHQAGRVRTVRFGPRTLDLDILLYADTYVCFADLQIPHPRMWERAFVVVPLAELHPDGLARGGWRISELARVLAAKGEVRRVGRFW